jgi:hypothetical protein
LVSIPQFYLIPRFFTRRPEEPIYLGQGKKTSKPLLHDMGQAKTQYQSDFTQSVKPEGDGAGGLHPPQADNPAAGQDDVDVNSLWLTTHGLEAIPSGTGINQLVQALLDIIGVAAQANGNGRGPYATQALALAQAVQDKGTGLLGSRTGNSEVYSTGAEPALQWWIGQNGIDTPDDYALKASFISGLQNIRDGIDGMVGLYQTALAMFQGAGREIIDEFRIELPDQDVSALEQAIAQFQNFSQTVQGHIDFFNQYGDPFPATERAAINARLENVKIYVETIVNGVNDRCNGIPALLGNASSGLNKHLTHWVAELVKKPDGPYAMILGAQTMLAMAEANIQKKDTDLNFFEQNKNLWMESTVIQAIYDRAVLDLDQTIKRVETDVMWNLIQAANKYKVLAMPFNEIPMPLSNEPWDESSGAWIANRLESGFLNNMKTIIPPAATTVFRVIVCDTNEGDAGDFSRTDAFDTKSKQTDIVSGALPFIQKDNGHSADGRECSLISFDEVVAKQVKERDFLWVNESEIAQIIAVSDSDYLLDTVYGTINSIRKLMGLYYAVPAETE